MVVHERKSGARRLPQASGGKEPAGNGGPRRGARTRVVILGGGFGGAYCAQELEKRLPDSSVEIVLIDRNNYFIFYPLLIEAGTGSLQPRHAVVTIRAFLKRSRFLMAEVREVDPGRRMVRVRLPETGQTDEIFYDHLVISLGSITRMPPVPGLEEHGYQIKNLEDAIALRDRAVGLLEAAEATEDPRLRRSLLHWVVVGGNYTGAEVAGEFHAFLQQAGRRYPGLSPRDVRVTLVELQDRILSNLDPGMSRYAQERMRRRGIDLRLGSSVSRIEKDSAELSNGQVLDARTVIWCAGIAPNPLLSKLPFPKDAQGYLLCRPDLRVQGQDGVWGIGDCAVNPDPQGRPYPSTAQHAVRQGGHLGRNLARVLNGDPPEPFEFRTVGVLAALGCRTGVAEVFGLRLSGFPAWFLWRTVYLLKMPGWWRRLQVALDWSLDLLFPREFVQLGLGCRGRRSAEDPPAGEG